MEEIVNKPLKRFSNEDVNSSLNSSLVIKDGLSEIDDDIEQIQKDLRRAERGIYLSTSIDFDDEQDSVLFGSPNFQKKNKSRSVLDARKTEESFHAQISHLERENFDLNSDLLRLTKDNKKLVKEIYEKNLTIREMGKNKSVDSQKSLEFQKINNEVIFLKDEVDRLGQEIQNRDSMISSLRMQINSKQEGVKIQSASNNERLQQYLKGMEAEKERLSKSDSFLKMQIQSMKIEIAKLRETQKKSLELTEAQQIQFEQQKSEDSLKIRNMKKIYETKFEDVKKDYESSYQKIKEEYRNDVEKYQDEVELKDNEIRRLRNIIRKHETKGSKEFSRSSETNEEGRSNFLDYEEDEEDGGDAQLKEITTGSEEDSQEETFEVVPAVIEDVDDFNNDEGEGGELLDDDDDDEQI